MPPFNLGAREESSFVLISFVSTLRNTQESQDVGADDDDDAARQARRRMRRSRMEMKKKAAGQKGKTKTKISDDDEAAREQSARLQYKLNSPSGKLLEREAFFHYVTSNELDDRIRLIRNSNQNQTKTLRRIRRSIRASERTLATKWKSLVASSAARSPPRRPHDA